MSDSRDGKIEELKQAKAEHPEAEVLTHPECPKSLLDLSDYIGSTSGIIDRVGKSDAEEFIICTENGVRYELEKDIRIKSSILQKQNRSVKI